MPVKENPPIRGSAQRRIAAPIDAVWEELSAAETLMATMPIEDVRVDAEAATGSFVARIGLGPLQLSRPGSGSIKEIKQPERVVFELALDDQSMKSLHTAELTAAGEDETLLNYSVELQPAHPMPRLRRFLSGVFDMHVRDYADRVSNTAARHWRAEQALGLRDPKDN
ncbi:MAG: SRPBCC domain-containing protein [Solirubrobacteraceae bacterium]